jgi:hypothetical protein
MKLLSRSVWIFTALILFLLWAALFPTPAVVGISIFLGSFLVLVQAYIILKDEQ